MRIEKILKIIIVLGVIFSLYEHSNAQQKSMGPINRYEKKEGGGLTNDFIVEFLIPKSNSWRVEASGDKEKKVLGGSSSTRKIEGNKIRITITTGQRARKSHNYWGNIHAWANALTIYYVPTPSRP